MQPRFVVLSLETNEIARKEHFYDMHIIIGARLNKHMSRKKWYTISIIIIPTGHGASRHNSSSIHTYFALNGKLFNMLSLLLLQGQFVFSQGCKKTSGKNQLPQLKIISSSINLPVIFSLNLLLYKMLESTEKYPLCSVWQTIHTQIHTAESYIKQANAAHFADRDSLKMT